MYHTQPECVFGFTDRDEFQQTLFKHKLSNGALEYVTSDSIDVEGEHTLQI